MMGYKLILTLVYITPALCQYAMDTDTRADVTFGEESDRFDISNIIQEQRRFEEYLAKKRINRHKNDGDKSRSSEETRRNFEYPKNMFARRWDGGFAYHDDMTDDATDDYEKNLAIFKGHNDGRRRNLNIFKYLRKPGVRQKRGAHRHQKKFKHGRIGHRRSGKKTMLKYKVPDFG